MFLGSLIYNADKLVVNSHTSKKSNLLFCYDRFYLLLCRLKSKKEKKCQKLQQK